jgi:hypothetical protein
VLGTEGFVVEQTHWFQLGSSELELQVSKYIDPALDSLELNF